MISASRRKCGGMSIIELMIAMAIGLFLIAGAISLFAVSKRTYSEAERTARMGENARFALQALGADLRLAGFFGEVSAADISGRSGLAAVTGDCTGRGEAYRFDNYLFVTRTDIGGNAIGCIGDAVPNTDVVIIKSVRPFPFSDGVRDDPGDDDGTIDMPGVLSGEKTYVMANNITGRLFDGGGTVPSIGEGGRVPRGNAWEYRFQAYYIRAGDVPQLSRKVLSWNGTGMAVTTEDVVDGVENLQVMIGEDRDRDGETDRYLDSTDTSIDWSRVTSMKGFLLVRSADRDTTYTDQRAYTLGNTAVAAPNDNFHRIVVQSDVSLRNSKLLVRGTR